MKSINEKSEEYLQQEKDEILCVYDRYAGFVDGANYVLEQLEEFQNFFATCITSTAREYLKNIIEQLKGNQ